MKILLLLLIAVSACYSLPSAGPPVKTRVRQLLTAFEQLQSCGRSFLNAADNGLDATELVHLKLSASEASAKVTKAIQAVNAILGDGQKSGGVISKALDILLKDVDDESLSGVIKLALLSADPLASDGVRLYVYTDLFQKRMKTLDSLVEQLRGLLDKTDEDITTILSGLVDDLTDEGTVLLTIFDAADDSFQDAFFASRLLVKQKEEEEEEDQAKTSGSQRTERSLRRRRGWSIGVGIRGGFSWSRRNFNIGVRGGVGLNWSSRGGFRAGGHIGVRAGWRF